MNSMNVRRPIARGTFALCAFVLSSFSISVAQTSNESALPKPSSVSTIGAMRVERYGQGSPAMIFVPGLASGSWVWDDAVRTFAGSHAVYVVTLGGFDGLPAPAGPLLDGADASLLQLITDEKLDRPILVGHSLGGYLVLRFGTEHASLVRGIVAVDGTPVLPPLAGLTPEQRAAAADGFSAGIRSATPQQFVTTEQQTIATMVTDPENAAHVAALSAKSDQLAVAAYFGELFRVDLRPELTKLTVPTLEIAPVPTVPATTEGPQAATATMADRQAAYSQFYRVLFPGAPNLTVVTIPNSKHFIMVDQPKALFDAIGTFVATLK
jgi:pimeloyl-ACP methyl ester carboxylesterase